MKSNGPTSKNAHLCAGSTLISIASTSSTRQHATPTQHTPTPSSVHRSGEWPHSSSKQRQLAWSLRKSTRYHKFLN